MSESDGMRGTVPRYRRMNVLGGALVCLAAIGIGLESMGLAVGELSYFGPGFLPRILAVILLAGGISLLAIGLLQPPAAAEGLELALRGPAAVGLAILVFALTIRGVEMGPIHIPQLGILIAGPLTIVIAGMGSSEARLRELVVLGISVTAAAILVFADALSMQLPVFPAGIESGLQTAWGPDWPRRLAVIVYGASAYGLWRAFGMSLAKLQDGIEGDMTP